jgi:predicted ATPase
VITRIEIDGFKSFMDFELDVPPFLVVMGENAGGKSNLIDALMALAGGIKPDDPLQIGAAQDRGIPAELFHQYEDGTRASALRLVADCRMYQTRAWSVDVRIRRTASYDEELSAIDLAAVDARLFSADVQGALSPSFDELSTWVALNLAPSAMRSRALASDRRPLQSNGSNVAAVLGRLSEEAAAWQILLADAVALLPELRDIRVNRDRDYWELELRSRGSGWMSAHTASDGTLRVLAILAAAHDPDHPSVLIIDEVENGLHPSRLAELIRRLRRITQDSLADGPARQMILTTHSPVVLSALYPEHENEVFFFSTAYGPRTVEGRKVGSLRTVVEPVAGDKLPRAVVRYILSAVQPMEPPR